MIQREVKEKIKKYLNKQGVEKPVFDVISTKNLSDGDFYTNAALKYASELKITPIDMATDISKYLESPFYTTNISKPGFLNFVLSSLYLSNELNNINKQGSDYAGTPEPLENKVYIVEYSSPNIAKPFSIGHFRSTIIGDVIANLLEFSGKKVIRDNHLGDWGTQFGKLIYAIKTWGNLQEIESSPDPIKLLVDLYVKFHKEAEINPELNKLGRLWFKKLEKGDVEAYELWEKCIDWSLLEFNRIYDLLRVRFDTYIGESKAVPKTVEVLKELEDKKLLKKDKGAGLVYYPNNKYPPLMLVKEDGTTLYSTRDLATDKNRISEYGNNVIIINEVGSDQNLYFEQLYELERMLSWFDHSQRIHVKHGLYSLKDSKMSTRKGNVVWLDDVLHQAVEEAQNLSDDVKNKELATIVGIGALKWNDLKHEAHKDIVFDWNEVLNMNGNSGPYIQYTYARTQSVIAKSPDTIIEPAVSVTNLNTYENTLIRTIVKYPSIVERATVELAPHYICHYLFSLAQAFNSFYNSTPILSSDNKAFRLALTNSTAILLKSGLNLLGITAPNRM